MPGHRKLSLAILALGLAGIVVALAGSGGSAAPAAATTGHGSPGHVYHNTTSPRDLFPPSGEAPEPSVSAASVIGGDGRIRITSTAAYPFRTVAYLELYDKSDKLMGSCTGTFVGVDAVLTAGHCLFDTETGEWTANIRVVPGKDASWEPFGYQWAKDWWVPDAYYGSGEKVYDWGMIKMPNSALATMTGYLSVGLESTGTLQRADFTPAILGYPGDKPDGTMWGMAVPAFKQVTEFRLFYDIDTAPGQSGSAIWSLNLDAYFLGYIVGIHTTGAGSSSPWNSGSRVDRELLDDLLEACSQMSCTLAYAIEVPGSTPTPTNTPTATPTKTPTATPTVTRTPGPRAMPYHSYGVWLSRD